jgi:uncharacterized phage protein (TIGR02218 family)
MKILPAGMQDHLDTGVTTLCWCWKLTRADGLAQGFTDHDADVAFAGIVFAAASGFTASEMQSALGFAVDNLSVAGALSAASLNETDLAAGLYDHAAVEIWRVNWAVPEMRVLMRSGTLGEVKRGKSAFEAEIRGAMQALNQPVGRAFCYDCDADLGDARCGVDLTAPALRGNGLVAAATDRRRFTAAGLDAFAAGWFAGGRLTWTSGANAGRAIEVKRHGRAAAGAALEIWQEASEAIAPGDGFIITAGCARDFTTCKKKFSNAARFRGFPYMPGNDAVIAYATSTAALDGGSRYGN